MAYGERRLPPNRSEEESFDDIYRRGQKGIDSDHLRNPKNEDKSLDHTLVTYEQVVTAMERAMLAIRIQQLGIYRVEALSQGKTAEDIGRELDLLLEKARTEGMSEDDIKQAEQAAFTAATELVDL